MKYLYHNLEKTKMIRKPVLKNKNPTKIKISNAYLIKIYLLIRLNLIDLIHLNNFLMINKKWMWMSLKLLRFYLWAIGYKPRYLIRIQCKPCLQDCEKLCFQ